MYRAEFLKVMEQSLSAGMSDGKTAAHLRYYEDYIQSRVRAGESEEAVIESLGDPRLIARTLLDTDDKSRSYEEDTSDHYRSYSQENSREEETCLKKRFHLLDLSTWYGKAIVIVLAILILYVLIKLLVAAIPFFLILAAVLFVIRYIKDR